jgi:hypothetical protein
MITLASKVRAGDVVFVGSPPQSRHVLAVAPASGKIRIISEAGSFELHPQQRVRVA